MKLSPNWLQETLKDAKITNPQPLVRGRQIRNKASTSTHAEVNFAFMQSIISSPTEPTSAMEAIQIPHWKKAMEEEMSSIDKNDTWFWSTNPQTLGLQNQISFRREH